MNKKYHDCNFATECALVFCVLSNLADNQFDLISWRESDWFHSYLGLGELGSWRLTMAYYSWLGSNPFLKRELINVIVIKILQKQVNIISTENIYSKTFLNSFIHFQINDFCIIYPSMFYVILFLLKGIGYEIKPCKGYKSTARGFIKRWGIKQNWFVPCAVFPKLYPFNHEFNSCHYPFWTFTIIWKKYCYQLIHTNLKNIATNLHSFKYLLAFKKLKVLQDHTTL